MNMERIFNLAGSFVALATVTVVLTSPQTVNVIRAGSSFFTGSIRAAMGK